MVALRASPLGCGLDIGGSIRIPAHCNGVVGFKPTPDRITRVGMSCNICTRLPGRAPIMPTAGPIANSVADCEIFIRALVGPNMWEGDPNVAPVPWNGTLAQRGPGRPLRIGFFISDGWFEPCSAVSRSVQEAAAALKNAGHEVIPFTPTYTGWDVFRIFYGITNRGDKIKSMMRCLRGEPLMHMYLSMYIISLIPNCLRPIVAFLLLQIGNYRFAHLVTSSKRGGISIESNDSLVADIRALQTDMHNAMKDSNVDALLFPTLPIPAFKHGGAWVLSAVLTYCFIMNVLHWPSGCVPVTVVAENEQEYYNNHDLPKKQRCTIGRNARKHMKGTAGLPCSVQIMTGSYKDELCLYAMGELERELCKSRPEHYMVPPLARDTNSK